MNHKSGDAFFDVFFLLLRDFACADVFGIFFLGNDGDQDIVEDRREALNDDVKIIVFKQEDDDDLDAKLQEASDGLDVADDIVALMGIDECAFVGE